MTVKKKKKLLTSLPGDVSARGLNSKIIKKTIIKLQVQKTSDWKITLNNIQMNTIDLT